MTISVSILELLVDRVELRRVYSLRRVEAQEYFLRLLQFLSLLLNDTLSLCDLGLGANVLECSEEQFLLFAGCTSNQGDIFGR